MLENIKNAALKPLSSLIEQKAMSLLDERMGELFGVLPTASGVVVTGNSAMRVPAVLQAVRLISETIGSLPCKLYREAGDSKEVAKDHPGHKITHSRANDWTSAGQLRIDLTIDALLHGAGYAQVVRASDDRPLELHRLDPSKVQRRCEDDGEPSYLVSTDRGQVRLSYRDVLYIPAFAGVSPVKLGREAIGIGLTLEKHTSNLFSDGARPSGMFWSENSVPDTDAGTKTIANILRDYRAAFSGGKQNRPLMVPAGYRYQQIALASTDAQFIENRLEQINEVARIFGVPPHMLYQLERATWSNAEQMAASFLQLCLRPWLDKWQDAYATVLLTDEERDTFYFEFVIDDLQRADAAGRAEIFGKLVAMRAMTPNEVRAAMNLPALPGGDELANPYTTTTTTGPAERQQPKEA
ncbi:phage portal protein [Rhizobium pusense]|uniref:Head portal protein, HK97 family n=1 Tax=Agrobacterium genomosp. 2 str. CFBP 5494 TaxID=1183436 RepID=A0A9W5AZ19_9HYPH|nr:MULTISPECIES: phage portal protein [Rhizobium/Agrobacterium group]MDH0907744.1 phage portal protein [Agrobacterium pusense]MDH1094434.1 phage portal protein [Agrobacterium pusense]MDH1111641.1 phage portal protein [Agrobacterium pusense]MDH2192414.1 phage portal protein [Agrobacterium pusense]OJH53445.1 head portal protein, HK97 family [Agrobacterium pusense]